MMISAIRLLRNQPWLTRCMGLALLLFPALLFIPHLSDFPYPSEAAAYSDLAISHYPLAHFLRHSLLEAHCVPLWYPGILSGSFLAGNPLAGLWYPPGWLALLLPLPLGLNLLIMLHVIVGGLGMYLFLRRMNLSSSVALFGGLAFEMLPKLYAHYGAGHLTLLYAVPWTPWLLAAAQTRKTQPANSALAEPTLPRKQLRKPCKALFASQWGMWREALVLGLIALADVRWVVYALGLWWGYGLFQSSSQEEGRGWLRWKKRFTHLLAQTLLAGMFSAPLLVPLVEFTRLSSRAHLGAADIFAFSLPLWRLLGFLFPDFHGFHEWMLYSGGMVFALALLGWLGRKSIPGVLFWWCVVLIGVVLALGSYIPGLVLLGAFPGVNWLRVPARALFLVGFAMAVLAALTVQRLMGFFNPHQRHQANLLLTALACFCLALGLGIGLTLGRLPLPYLWGSGVAVLGAIWIGLRVAERLRWHVWLAGVFVICLIDWVAVDISLYHARPVTEVFAQGEGIAQILANYTGKFRVYSPSYSLPQQTAANYGIELADGVDPLQLQSYVRFMQAATGVPWTGYSVTLPPFANSDPQRDNAFYRPDPDLLGWLNVRFVASAFDLQVEGLRWIAQVGETRLYENTLSLPRAWLQASDAPLGQQVQPVEIRSSCPNSLQLQVSGPGRLVLAEVYYPGWQAWLDGKRLEIQAAADLLRSVEIPAGVHQVVFLFRPTSVSLGLVLWAVSVLLMLFLPLRKRS